MFFSIFFRILIGKMTGQIVEALMIEDIMIDVGVMTIEGVTVMTEGTEAVEDIMNLR